MGGSESMAAVPEHVQSVCPCVPLSLRLALELPLQGYRHQGISAPTGCAWIKLIQTAVRPLQYLSYCPYNETLLLVIARRLNLSKDTVSEY